MKLSDAREETNKVHRVFAISNCTRGMRDACCAACWQVVNNLCARLSDSLNRERSFTVDAARELRSRWPSEAGKSCAAGQNDERTRRR